jgi:hypothetical protein
LAPCCSVCSHATELAQSASATINFLHGTFICFLHAHNAAVSGRPKGESVLTAWFPARAERGQQAVAAYRRIPYRAKRGRERRAKPRAEAARSADVASRLERRVMRFFICHKVCSDQALHCLPAQ